MKRLIRWWRGNKLIVLAIVTFWINGCGALLPGAEVSFRPLNGPIIFSIDNMGKISIKGNLGTITPIGTFTVEMNASTDPRNVPSPSETLFTLRHLTSIDGDQLAVEDLYKINANSGINASADGHIEVTAVGNRILVDATKAKVNFVRLVGPSYFDRPSPIKAGNFRLAASYATRDNEKWTLDSVSFSPESVRFEGRVENIGLRKIVVSNLDDLGYAIQRGYLDNERLSSTGDSFGSGNPYSLTLARNQGRQWFMNLPNNGEFRYGESVYVWFAYIGWQITLPTGP